MSLLALGYCGQEVATDASEVSEISKLVYQNEWTLCSFSYRSCCILYPIVKWALASIEEILDANGLQTLSTDELE